MPRSRIAILVTIVAIGCGCRPQTVFEQLLDARRLTAEILLHFTKSADATNRAVMAGAEEAATAFVGEAQQATRDVQSNADLLRPILDDLRYSKESRLLAEFETKFSEYRALDSRIQELVVESTNLALSRRNSNVHALALSLGQKRILVAACEEALRTLQGELANRGFPGTR